MPTVAPTTAPAVTEQPTATRLVGAIMQRVEEGQSLADMQTAIELAERMMRHEQDRAVSAALYEVQQVVTAHPVPHNRKHANLGFTYADAAAVLEHVEGPVKAAGFAFSADQDVAAGTFTLVLRHRSGGEHRTTVQLVEGRANKQATEQMVAMGGVSNAIRRAWIQMLQLRTAPPGVGADLPPGPGDGEAPTAPPEHASPEQVRTLVALLERRETTHEGATGRMLEYYRVETVSELTTTQATRAINELEARLG